ncbi:MAG: type II toxin-antitoxin system VapC family toxin [Chromatiaceae bacterium]
MIGLDTNILVRYITQDEPEQAAQATRLIEASCTSTTPGRVAHIVLCELVWVLSRAYGYSKPEVVSVLDQILITAELAVENEGVAFQALDAYREGPADFSDYLLALSNRAAGCEITYSFDTRLCEHHVARLPP